MNMLCLLGRTVVLGTAATMMLSGCAMWPSMKSDSDLVGVGKGMTAGKDCSQLLTNLTDAYACLSAAKEEMESALDDVGHYELGLGYAAVAGGTAAGYNLAKAAPNMTVVKNLGIGLAALVGVDKVVGPDKQRQALNSGVKAMLCVSRAAHASESVAGAFNGMSVTSFNALSPNEFTTKLPAQFKAPDAKGVDKLGDALGARLAAGSAIHVGAQQSLLSAVAAQSNTVLAEQVRSAVVAIRSAVRAQLLDRNADPAAIFKEQQQRVNQMLKDVTSKALQTQMAYANLAANQRLLGIPVEADPTKPAVKPVLDAYQECAGAITDPGS